MKERHCRQQGWMVNSEWVTAGLGWISLTGKQLLSLSQPSERRWDGSRCTKGWALIDRTVMSNVATWQLEVVCEGNIDVKVIKTSKRRAEAVVCIFIKQSTAPPSCCCCYGDGHECVNGMRCVRALIVCCHPGKKKTWIVSIMYYTWIQPFQFPHVSMR